MLLGAAALSNNPSQAALGAFRSAGAALAGVRCWGSSDRSCTPDAAPVLPRATAVSASEATPACSKIPAREVKQGAARETLLSPPCSALPAHQLEASRGILWDPRVVLGVSFPSPRR